MKAMNGIGFTPVGPSEVGEFRDALEAAGLPAEDAGAPDVRAFRFTEGDRRVGYGALEIHGGDVLLRSIVVAPDARGRGVGRKIVEALLAQARAVCAGSAYLLTTDARRYFEAFGFEPVERSRAPHAILTTRQAAGLCPASATLMARPLVF